LETKKQMKSTQTFAVWVLFFCVFLNFKVAQKTARVIAELLFYYWKLKKPTSASAEVGFPLGSI
jgi:hypothetical protein